MQAVRGSTTHLARGTCCAFPVASPPAWRSSASSLVGASQTFRRLIPSKETSLSLHPSIKGRIASPLKPTRTALEISLSTVTDPWRNVRRFIRSGKGVPAHSPRPHPNHRHRRWTYDHGRVPPFGFPHHAFAHGDDREEFRLSPGPHRRSAFFPISN